jgi:hypothetical protein
MDTQTEVKAEKYDELGAIMAYEAGELSDEKSLELFAHLVKTGLAWKLQGSYGRTAAHLIERGYLDRYGRILKDVGED